MSYQTLNAQAVDIILGLCTDKANEGFGRILICLSRDKEIPCYSYDVMEVINILLRMGFDVALEEDVDSIDVIVGWDNTKPLWTTSGVYMVKVNPSTVD